MKKSLAQKFSFCFHVPLIICTVLSILVTIPLIGYFFDLLSKDPTILKIYEDNIERKARPILLNVMSILCVTFQKYINNLSKIREFYRESIKLLKSINFPEELIMNEPKKLLAHFKNKGKLLDVNL